MLLPSTQLMNPGLLGLYFMMLLPGRSPLTKQRVHQRLIVRTQFSQESRILLSFT